MTGPIKIRAEQAWSALAQLVTRGQYSPGLTSPLHLSEHLVERGWAIRADDPFPGTLRPTDAGRAYYEDHRARSAWEIAAAQKAGREKSHVIWSRAAGLVAEQGVHLSSAYLGGIGPWDALRQACDELDGWWPGIEAQGDWLDGLEAGQTTEQVVTVMRAAADAHGPLVTVRDLAARWRVSASRVRHILGGVEHVDRHPDTGAKRYAVGVAQRAWKSRPGQGARTDLAE